MIVQRGCSLLRVHQGRSCRKLCLVTYTSLYSKNSHSTSLSQLPRSVIFTLLEAGISSRAVHTATATMTKVLETPTGEITLYANKGCFFAHRVPIVLRELGLEYERFEIDLEKPREPWYLEISKAGLVPALQHTHPSIPGTDPVTLVESQMIVQYLIDAFPDLSQHLVPAGKDPESAYKRYTTNSLIDLWMNKIFPVWWEAVLMSGTDQEPAKADKAFEAIQTIFEPKLAEVTGQEGQGPFIGGAERPTLFEVMVASFVIRIHDYSNDRIHPKSLAERLDSLPAYSKWSKAVISQDSVTYCYDKEFNVDTCLRVIPGIRKKLRVPGYE